MCIPDFGVRTMWKHPDLDGAYFVTDMDRAAGFLTYRGPWDGVLPKPKRRPDKLEPGRYMSGSGIWHLAPDEVEFFPAPALSKRKR